MAAEEAPAIFPTATRGTSLWSQSLRRLMRKKVGMICLAVILIMYLAGIFAAWVTPHDYRAVDTQYPKRPLPWVDAKLATKTVVERVKNRTTEVSVDGARKLKQGTGINQAPELNRDLAVGDRVQIVSRVAGSWSHPFGTDRAGRDLLTRVIYGLRTTVIITILAIVTGGLFLGIGLGLLSGYFEKWVDSLIMRVGEIFLAFPDILLVLLIAATLRPRVVDWVRDIGGNDLVRLGIPDYLVVFGALAAFSWVGMARLVRGQVLYVKQAQFVEAAQAAGASTRRILGIHVLPNVISPVIVLVSMGMGQAAGAEIILSWLGIGIQPPTPSLGVMIFENGNIGVLRSDPHLLLFPVGVITVLIFAFNLLGDALNDAFNPRSR